MDYSEPLRVVSDPATEIARALRADAARLGELANNLRVTNLGPAMRDVQDAAQRLRSAANAVEKAAQ